MKLHLAPEQSFRCHSCGRCCRNSWDIRVEPSARQAIAQSQAAAEGQKQGFLPLVVLADETLATGRRPDGACVFLTERQLCALHAELGGQRKPLACQLYPYALTATPDGFFASLSFACPSVVAGLSGDRETNLKELEDLLRERGNPQSDGPHQVEVVAGRTISWACYRELEGALLKLHRPHDPVGSLLDAAVAVVQVLNHCPQGDPVWSSLGQIEREEGFEESLLAMFCASVIALWELPDHPEERQAFSQSVLAGEPLQSRQHIGLVLPPWGLRSAATPLLTQTFERYFANAIFGKSLLSGSVLSRLLALACGCALVLYYADVFAQTQTAPGVNLESLSSAFELVESDLVTHTRSADSLFTTFESTLCQAYGAAG